MPKMSSIRTLWKLIACVFLASCAAAPIPVPQSWETVPLAAIVGDYCLHVACAPAPKLTTVHVAENRLFNGTKPLTPPFAAIESFDVSLERKEVVFSAKRTTNFDVGLVSV